MDKLVLSPMNQVIEALQAGKAIIMVDDDDRENEGDLVVASEKITAESLAFMMNTARGLICVTLSHEIAGKLKLKAQVEQNNSPYQTAFTISVDHCSVQANGVEARARAKTIKAIIDEQSVAEDFIVPGHVFPLVANPAGVLGRRGQTEGSLDLARIAGLFPSGVICEILNPDGSMARGQELQDYATRHNLLITSVAEIVKYRIQNEILVRPLTESQQMTSHGMFTCYVFLDDVTGKEHLVLRRGSTQQLTQSAPLVRVHSECLTGDVFGSRRCDCGEQLEMSLSNIAKQECGLILYLRQEGRGIGLANKLRAYELQDLGLDTVDANIQLGFKADERDFIVASKILQYFGISKVRLMTNNPEKIDTLVKNGIEISERVSVVAHPDPLNAFYIQTKQKKMGHLGAPTSVG